MHADLLMEIRAFLQESGMSPTYFGQAAVGNVRLIKNLEDGRPIQTDTVEKVRAFMRLRRAGVKYRHKPTPRANASAEAAE